MFKLFKELTRPPEPLIASSNTSNAASGSRTPPSLVYTPRQRSRSISAGLAKALEAQSGRQAQGSTAAAASAKENEDAIETDEDAKKVVELLKDLDESQGIMSLVEVSKVEVFCCGIG